MILQLNNFLFFKVCFLVLNLFLVLSFAQKNQMVLPEINVYYQDSTQTFKIPVSQIERQISLVELFQEIPSLVIRKQSGLGAFSQLSFRGGQSQQILFFLDNVLLNDEINQSIDISKIPIRLISRIEIDVFGVKEQSLFHSGVLSVYLYTIEENTESKESSLGASVQVGSFSQYQFSTYYKKHFKRLQYHVFAVGQWAKNDFLYLNNQNTKYNTRDDFIDRRSNNQYYNGLVRGHFLYPFNATNQLKINLQLQKYRRHFPGISNEQAFSTVNLYSIDLQMKNHFRNSKLSSLNWSFIYRYVKQDYKDPRRSQDQYRFELLREGSKIQGKTQAKFDFKPLVWQVGGVVLYEKLKDLNLTFGNSFYAPPNAQKLSGSWGQNLIWSWRNFQTQAKTNLTYYRWRSDSVAIITRAKKSFAQNRKTHHLSFGQKFQNRWLRIQAQYRLENRAPSLDEFLGDNHVVIKNLGLKNQKTNVFQVQLEFFIWTKIQLSMFAYQYQKPIGIVFLNDRYSRYENQSNYNSKGFEFSMHWIPPSLRQVSSLLESKLETRTAYLKSRIDDPSSNFHQNIPAFSHRWKHHVNFSWSGIKNLTFSAVMNYKSSYFESETNFADQKKSSYILWSFFVTYHYKAVQIQSSVYNLTNVIYNDFRYQPNSGRSFFLTLTAHV